MGQASIPSNFVSYARNRLEKQQIRTSGFRSLAGCEAVLEARARAYSSSHAFCMVFSVNLEIRPILSLISLSLLAVVLVL